MLSLDVFNTDPFGLVELTKVINDTPYTPGRVSELGWFRESGISTTVAMIEQKGRVLSLVPNAPRGQTGTVKNGDKAKVMPVLTTHLPQAWSILADEVQNIRAFGSTSELKMLQDEVRDRLAKCRSDLDVTIEFQRLGALKGKILNSDLSEILDLFTLMGTSQLTHAMALATGTTKVRNKIIEARRKSEKELGGRAYTGHRGLCSAGFFDALVSSDAAAKAYDRWQDGEALRADVRTGFKFGDVIWEEYRGTVGGVDFIADGDAYLVPEGIPNFMNTYFAPADYMDTVNTKGLPYYARQERMEMDRGIKGETQSNPIHIVEVPSAIIRLTA